jgi:hypothetical protein
MTTLQDVLAFIGTADENEITAVFETARARSKGLRTIRAAEAKATLRPGDRVRLTNLRPQYVNGATGTVADTGGVGGKVLVTLDDNVDGRVRARFGPSIRVPASALLAVA